RDELRERRARDRRERDAPRPEMRQAPLEVVRDERAALARGLPRWIEHEVVDDELRMLAEEIAQADPTFGRVERVVLLDARHRQRAPLGGELVAHRAEGLLLRDQRLARRQ